MIATFAALSPSGCGVLTSHPSYTSCSSLSGFEWGFHPALDSFWNNHYTVLTAQAVLLGYAAAMAAAVLAVTWFVPRLTLRPARQGVDAGPRGRTPGLSTPGE